LSNPDSKSIRKGVAALVGLCVVWGYTWVILKEGLRFAGPFDYSALRTLPGALVLFGIVALRGEPLALRAPRKTFIFGLVQTTAFNGLVSWALVAGAAGKTAVLVYTMPFWTLLIAWPVLGERIRGAQWIAVALSAAGLVLVVEPWHLAGTLASKLLGLATGIAWAVSAVLAKRWRDDLGSDLLRLTAWQMFLGGLVLAAIAAVVPSRPVEWTPYFWFLLIYATAFGSVAGWLLWFYVLQRLPAGIAGLSVMAVPAIGVAASRIQLNETPSSAEAIGMALIGASLAVLSWRALRQQRARRRQAT
jgi:drug/metabolite transporter (DMT)-like permease